MFVKLIKYSDFCIPREFSITVSFAMYQLVPQYQKFRLILKYQKSDV